MNRSFNIHASGDANHTTEYTLAPEDCVTSCMAGGQEMFQNIHHALRKQFADLTANGNQVLIIYTDTVSNQSRINPVPIYDRKDRTFFAPLSEIHKVKTCTFQRPDALKVAS